MSSFLDCSCGHQLQLSNSWNLGAIECPACGETLSIPDSESTADEAVDLKRTESRYCPVCGKKLLPKESWCTTCKAPIEKLALLRDDPRKALELGMCPSCGQKLLPKQTACPRCAVVIANFIEGRTTEPATITEQRCRICGTRMLPKETACPQCKTPVDSGE